MFASLKNKIKEETGAEITTTTTNTIGPHQRFHNNNRMRSRFSSTVSVNSIGEEGGGNNEQHNALTTQLASYRSQVNELTTKVTDLFTRLQTLQEEKTRIEKTNEILLETVKVAQTQKDIYCEDQEKIQNAQQSEIEKIKSLLSLREQESLDRLSTIQQSQQQVEKLTTELERLKQYEHKVENLQDELETLRHSSQLEKNNFTTTLAAIEEENNHLKKRLQIVEKARLETLSTLNANEKVQALVQERKLLEQHLEEAHLQLSDIKSSWSGQNLALETQVSRLSKQVAEETTEKRKALKARDDLNEKVKQLEFEMLKLRAEIKQRNDKIQLLTEEINELNGSLRKFREDNEQQILFERNRVETLEKENNELRTRLTTADERFTEYAANAEHISQTLRQQNAQLQEQLQNLQNLLDSEKEEKLTAVLRCAEISQSEELLKKELRLERDESNELNEKLEKLELDMKEKLQELLELKTTVEELDTAKSGKERAVDELQREIDEKNKTIKILNQRMSDLKKTLQREFRNTNKSIDISDQHIDNVTGITSVNGHHSTSTLTNTAIIKETSAALKSKRFCCNCATETTLSTAAIVMDEVNFKYLKHVIVKFLTSREVEARHLIRAVATLLQLTKEEEKLLHDTLNWKMSWFGSKPNHGSGQHAFSIPPS